MAALHETEARKERAAEVKAAAKGADGKAEVPAKIAAMAAEDRAVSSKFHHMVRVASAGFSDTTALDEGSMWATTFAVLEWNATNERQLRAFVTKAADSERDD